MNFSLFGRPRWKHADPQVRLKALADLDNQAELAQLALTDPSAEVRQAAFGRLTDQTLLADLSLGENEFSAAAVARLTDAETITTVAVRAKTPAARGEAVCRMEDRRLLNRIAAQDVDPNVRKLAKLKLDGPETLNGFLKTTLTKLQIAERRAAEAAMVCGNLDEVFAALGRDRRFRVNGVLAEAGGGEPLRSPPTERRPEETNALELLANKVPTEATGATLPVDAAHFRIRIQRVGPNEYGFSVKEHRPVPAVIAPGGSTPPSFPSGGDSRTGHSNPDGFSAGLAVAG